MPPAPQCGSFSAATVKRVYKWHRHVSCPLLPWKDKKWQPEKKHKKKKRKKKSTNATNLSLVFPNHKDNKYHHKKSMGLARRQLLAIQAPAHGRSKARWAALHAFLPLAAEGPFDVRLIRRDFGALRWVRAQLSFTASRPALVKKSDVWDRGCSNQKDSPSLLPCQHCS